MDKQMKLRIVTGLWQLFAVTMLVLFVGWSILVANVLRECYRPPNASETADTPAEQQRSERADTSAEQQKLERADASVEKQKPAQAVVAARWRERVVQRFGGDRSGASAVCIAILFLALARYGYLRWRIAVQRYLLENPSSSKQSQTMLGAKDPVALFLVTKKTKVDVQLLERRIGSSYDLHEFVGPCITLGLFGTLVGLWLGFIQTLGPTASLSAGSTNLQTALTGSVVVVATAALSSITGIGVGQLIIAPLAERIDRDVEELVNSLFDKTMATSQSSSARA